MVCTAYGKGGQQYSLLEYILRETEQLHGRVRRYTSPDEHAFYEGLYALTNMRCCMWMHVLLWYIFKPISERC